MMKTRIVCITANAALDRTLVVPGFTRGGVFRPVESLVVAGGKGLNVARAVNIFNGQPLCAGFLAGHAGNYLAQLAQQEGFISRWTRLDAGESRTCYILVDSEAGIISVINDRGPRVSDSDWQRLSDDIFELSDEADAICWCGSLPPGSSAAVFARCVAASVQTGKQVWADTSGEPLRAVLTVPGVCVKVNHEEAAEIAGKPVHSPADALQLARQFSDSTGGDVVITLGAQGAVIVTRAGEAWQAAPPALKVTSAVGSGDVFLAGLVMALAGQQSARAALIQAVAAGAANALSIGGGSFDMATMQSIQAQVTVTAGG